MEVLNRPDEALEDVNEMGWQAAAGAARNSRDIEMQRARSRSLVVRDTSATVLATLDSLQPPRGANDDAAPLSIDNTIRDSVSLSEATRPSPSVGSMTTIEHPPGAQGPNDMVGYDGTSRWKRFRAGFSEHFFSRGHWPTLLGTSLAWASFDFGETILLL